MRRLCALLTLTCLYTCGAGVHPPSELHEWFHEQHSVINAWCCDVSDGYLLEDDDWDNRGTDGAFRVKVQGVWYVVPADAARDPRGGPNPTGHAVVWYNPMATGIHIYCFAPGEMY